MTDDDIRLLVAFAARLRRRIDEYAGGKIMLHVAPEEAGILASAIERSLLVQAGVRRAAEART